LKEIKDEEFFPGKRITLGELKKSGWKEEKIISFSVNLSINLSESDRPDRTFKKGDQVLILSGDGVIKKTYSEKNRNFSTLMGRFLLERPIFFKKTIIKFIS
jgi:hypothetical protein